MDRRSLFEAFWNGDAEKITEQLNDLLFQTISYYDYRESYYHAFLSGIFVGAGYGVESKREYGTGRPDIVVADKKGRKAIIIEVKHSQKNSEMEADCMTAMRQIQERSYADGLLSGGIRLVLWSCILREKLHGPGGMCAEITGQSHAAQPLKKLRRRIVLGLFIPQQTHLSSPAHSPADSGKRTDSHTDDTPRP